MNREKVSDIINEWARDKPLIARVHVFGSRAKGSFRPGSDLDIAVEFDPQLLSDDDHKDGILAWHFETDGWEEQLQASLEYLLHFHRYKPSVEDIVYKAVHECSYIAYEKQS